MVESFHVSAVASQSVIGVGDSHYNALPGCWLGPFVRERRPTVAFGDIRATPYSEEPKQDRTRSSRKKAIESSRRS